MSTLDLVLVAGLVVAVYSLVARGLFELTRPIRAEMYRLGAQLVESNRLPKETSDRVIAFINFSSSSWVSWLMAGLVLPAFVWSLVERSSDAEGVPDDLRTKLNRFDTLWTICVIAAGPIGALVFLLQMLLLAGVTRVVGRSAIRMAGNLNRLIGRPLNSHLHRNIVHG